ncbi:MAG TPA: hypothetical protein VHI52_12905 [Verrucomicrobiae bacterium]|nr:hypothetical protein [Verrucomicrobiae bacterium]
MANRNWLFALADDIPQRFGGIRGGNASGEFGSTRRKRRLQSMHQKLFQSAEVGAVLELRAMDQLRRLGALHGGVHLRRTHR